MRKFKCINGWTKKKMLDVLEARRYSARAGVPNKSGYDTDFTCQYLSANGNKCAVGMFIPKKHEGLTFVGGYESLVDQYPDLKKVMPLKDSGMDTLQSVHDNEHLDAKQAMIVWVRENVES